MNKRILLLLIIFLIFPSLVFSIKTFVIQETEKLSLKVNATDPDADKLAITYSPPLNENGEWQTNYGDAGEYKATITVSDGIKSASNDVLIIVNKKEESPKIESFIPTQDTLNVNETESIDFRVLASDVNKDTLAYQWLLDGKKANDGQEFTYRTTYSDAGMHFVSAVVSDGTENVSKEWKVNVEKIDVQGLLDSIPDAMANENDVVSLKLPDFEKYGLIYTISEPIGNKNEWRTTYNDDGTYNVRVHAEGKGFSGDKIVKVIVNDIDRPPIFQPLENKIVNEDEELKIILNATDPDGDEITYSANNLPEGATLDGNIFAWKPSYDTVKKEGVVNLLMNSFGILSKSFYIQFAASSKSKKIRDFLDTENPKDFPVDKKIVQNVIITVKDVNRAPVVEDMEPMAINEGDTLRISPKAYDPDGDKVRLSYSGFVSKDTYNSKIGDAGTYNVKVTASDGKLETSKFVEVNIKHVNRAPVFEKIKDIKASEGDSIAVLLNAHDPDGDEINYSIDNPPEGSSIKGNSFLWTPKLHILNKAETKKYGLVFAVSDGKAETRQIANIELHYKNRVPRIINATTSVIAKVDEPVIMSVKAADEDGDDLTYMWKFGLFESYKATPIHQRIFTSQGTKVVKVVVSDGIDSIEQVIYVTVV